MKRDAPSRIERVTVRVTPNEKLALAAFAKSRGVSLSAFIMTAVRAEALRAAKSLDEVLRVRNQIRRGRTDRVRPAPKGKQVEPFKAPYLQPEHAVPLEEVVRYVAREMHTDEHTVAMLMTHLAEGIADVLVSGRVFRWPGVFAAGAIRVQTEEGEQCRPRFQAYPPLRNHVIWNCPVERACNKEMQSHRRRRRKERFGTLRSLMESTRYVIAKQDLRNLQVMQDFRSDWRDFAPTHDV